MSNVSSGNLCLTPTPLLASAEEIILEARAGRMFILVDDEDRENEGDLIIPAQMATPDSIAFMAREGRGLICLAMDGAMIDRLALPMMGQQQSRMQTAFTVSIEAREGVTTGISAADRARTIEVAIAPDARPYDLVSPGHVFPLRAREGGVLVRAGHTEAAVDVARAAGLSPAGVICEIMKDDGTMARLTDLLPFAARHRLKIGTIADLIAYRRSQEILIEEIADHPDFTSQWGPCHMRVFRNRLDGCEHIALIFGDTDLGSSHASTSHPASAPTPASIPATVPVAVRVHVENTLNDMLGGNAEMINRAVLKLKSHVTTGGRAVFVLIRDQNKSAFPNPTAAVPEYGIGSQILSMIGVRDMIVLTNHPEHMTGAKGLEAYGLRIRSFEKL